MVGSIAYSQVVLGNSVPRSFIPFNPITYFHKYFKSNPTK